MGSPTWRNVGASCPRNFGSCANVASVPVGAVDATERLNVLAHHRQFYANLKMELAILYPAAFQEEYLGHTTTIDP